MDALERVSSKIKGIKIAGIPVGDALLILLGLGVSDALVPAVTRFVKAPILSGGAIAFLSKVPFVERFLGSTFANVLSATAAATGIEDQIAVRARTGALVSSLVGRAVPTAGIATGSPSPRVEVAASPSLGQVPVSEQERRILESLKIRS